MFGYYILTLVWGGLNSRLGNYKHHTFSTMDELNELMESVSKRRLQRGYEKITADKQTVHGLG